MAARESAFGRAGDHVTSPLRADWVFSYLLRGRERKSKPQHEFRSISTTDGYPRLPFIDLPQSLKDGLGIENSVRGDLRMPPRADSSVTVARDGEKIYAHDS